jgi:GTP cyclohydrolase I
MENKTFNTSELETLEKAAQMMLRAVGETDTEALMNTPRRIAKAYEETLAGMKYSNEEIALKFGKTFDRPKEKSLVAVSGITANSICAHHWLPFNGHVAIGYLPTKRIIGLSKLPRIVDLCSRRTQTQEKLNADILDVLRLALETEDIAIVSTMKHGCMSARGIKSPASSTTVTTFRGEFLNRKNQALRTEFLTTLQYGGIN